MLPMWLWLTGDVALTLAGQPNAYWAGDYGEAIEVNPLMYPIVASGPWVFAGYAAAWAILLGVLVICWPHRLVKVVAIAAAVLNAMGGCSWLARMGGWGWLLAIGYLFVASEVSWWCWRRSLVNAKSPCAIQLQR
jgi:hypothetical protein